MTLFFSKKQMKNSSKMFKSLTRWKMAFIVLCILTALSVKVILTYPRKWMLIIHQTKYWMDVGGCERGADIYMLVLVGSHPDHNKIRNAIRQTWGNPRLDNYRFKLVFPFGKVSKTAQEQQLRNESERFGDILVGDFLDSYHNVTLRDLMALGWAVQHCGKVKYILHADDDIALDIYKLIVNLDKYYGNATELIACYDLLKKGHVFRDGRYALSKEEFPENVFPPYCEGKVYVLTPVVAREILRVAPYRKSLWINDVHITGTLIKDLSLNHSLLHLRPSISYPNMILFAQQFNISSNDEIKFEIGPINGNITLLMRLQEIYKRRAIRDKFITK